MVSVYKSDIVEIYAGERLEEDKGDSHQLFFRVCPSSGHGDIWTCKVGLGGVFWTLLLINYGVSDDKYNVLKELGCCKIRQSIQNSETFKCFTYSDYDDDNCLTMLKNQLRKTSSERI